MKNYLIAFVLVLGVASLAFFSNRADANPSQISTKSTSSASTTPSFMTPGAATTTLSFDTQEDGALSVDSAVLGINFSGSSTVAVLNVDIEYSQNGSSWYRDNTLFENGESTTTPSMNITTPNSYAWTFASSTLNGAGVNATSGATSTKMITVKTPTRYVRAVFSITGANTAIWAEFVAKKQSR